MKKIINLLCFLLILNFLILGNLIIKNYKNKNLLPIVYAKSFKHSNDNYNLIYKILKDTNKDNLIKYIDYLELNIIDNIPNDTNNNIAFTLSSPDKDSFIALYKKVNNNYKFEYIIDKLSTINSFYFYKDFLIVEQTNSNSSTNFTENEYLEIFYKNNNVYTSVLKKNIYNEKFTNIDNIKFKEIENSSIDCLNGDVPKLLCITTLTKYKSIRSDHDEFEEIDKIIKKEVFEWNDSGKTFMKSELNDIK